ncbi:MAG TPA: prepilin peptidase [Terriglobales bacterium]|nr:prepilin peptidase [Terriglobales bacterium]
MVPIELLREPIVLLACVFVYGLAFGSFLNVCIYRLPRGLSVVRPASACPSCDTPIKIYDNIPVLGWLLLRGKCRACREPISPRYLFVELLTALLFVLSFYFFGLSLQAFKLSIFAFLLVGLIFTDADLKLLPDRLTLPGLAIGLILSAFTRVDGIAAFLFNPGAFPFAPEITARILSVVNSVIGAVVGAGFIWLAGEAYKRVRGVEGMGFGDVKLMAMVGAFIGIKLTLLTLMLGSMSGALAGGIAIMLVYRKRLRRRRAAGELSDAARNRAWQSAQLVMRHFEMPFGVFLGIAALIAGVFGQPFVDWYLGFF